MEQDVLSLLDFSIFGNDQNGAKLGVPDGQTTCFLGSQKDEEQGVWNRLEKKMVELRGRLTLGQPCSRGLNSESSYWTGS